MKHSAVHAERGDRIVKGDSKILNQELLIARGTTTDTFQDKGNVKAGTRLTSRSCLGVSK